MIRAAATATALVLGACACSPDALDPPVSGETAADRPRADAGIYTPAPWPSNLPTSTTTTEPPITTTTHTHPPAEVRASAATPPAAFGSRRALWERVRECECPSGWYCNTGNGYFGGLQFALSSWRLVGGTGYPHEHTPEEQIHRAELLLERQGWRAWPTCSRKLGLR